MRLSRSTQKYRNVADGDYDSQKERRRHQELMLMEKAGEITSLERQVKYELIPKQDGERAVSYFADFRYVDKMGTTVIEDVKSPPTRKNPTYIIKRKLLKFRHGITITEV